MKNEIEKANKLKQQSLSVIYFFDGGKTRTLKIPLIFVKTGLFIFVLLIGWATIGSVMFVRNLVKMSEISKSLQTSLDTIFQYQIQYDSVIESTYRKEQKEVVQDTPKLETPTLEIPTLSETPLVEIQAPTKSTNLLDVKHLHVRSNNEDAAVALETPTLFKNEKVLTLSVALRNKKNDSRAEGLIWANLEWTDAQGEKHLVKAPEDIRGKHTPSKPNANTFSLRQYTVKTFSFQIPDDSSILSKIEIWLTDRQSNKFSFQITES